MPELSLDPKENWTKSDMARVLGLFLGLKLGLNFSIHGQSLRATFLMILDVEYVWEGWEIWFYIPGLIFEYQTIFKHPICLQISFVKF